MISFQFLSDKFKCKHNYELMISLIQKAGVVEFELLLAFAARAYVHAIGLFLNHFGINQFRHKLASVLAELRLIL